MPGNQMGILCTTVDNADKPWSVVLLIRDLVSSSRALYQHDSGMYIKPEKEQSD